MNGLQNSKFLNDALTCKIVLLTKNDRNVPSTGASRLKHLPCVSYSGWHLVLSSPIPDTVIQSPPVTELSSIPSKILSSYYLVSDQTQPGDVVSTSANWWDLSRCQDNQNSDEIRCIYPASHFDKMILFPHCG